VGSIDSFFSASMDLLDEPPGFDLRDPRWPSGSRFEEWLPARMVVGGDPATANLISAGCAIDRALLVRTIVSPMVRISDSCEIESSILFNGVKVGRGVRLRKVIVEEGVSIPPGVAIGFGGDRDHARSPGGVTVIARGHPFDASDEGGEHSRTPARRRSRAVGTR
jgi:glucose-1-phosphate adenylyltransferase